MDINTSKVMNKKSDIVKAFLDLIDESQEEYETAYEKVGECDRLTQDLLHKLELGGYKNRNRVATELARCRHERRAYKDVREEAEVIIGWTTSKEGARALNLIRNMLGDLRKVEQYHENRSYKPRVKK